MTVQRSKLDAPWVLLVVGDRDTREFLTLSLKRHLAGVIAAENAAEALRGLGALLPDVVVAQFRPDGVRLMEEMRRLPRDRGGALPAIALLDTRRNDEAAAIDAGFVVQLRMPVDPEDLQAAIEILTTHLDPVTPEPPPEPRRRSLGPKRG